jgi:hypothetical protein
MTHTRIIPIGAVILAGTALAQSPPIPRTADGKPDLTEVWQGGSNRVGTWEEANNPAAGAEFGTGRGQAAPGAKQLLAREPPPYQSWAAQKVLEFYNRRGIDDPEARCVAPGVPRITTIGLFPMEIVQTRQKVVMLYEVFSVFRIIPLNAKHPWNTHNTIMLRPGTRLREYECSENNADMERYEKLLKDDSVFRRK